MRPIDYDVLIAVIGFTFGIYSLFGKLQAHNKSRYTPFLPAMIVLMGLLCWFSVGLVSWAGVTEHPSALHSKGWYGSWGYTISRMFGLSYWLMTLTYLCTNVPRKKPYRRTRNVKTKSD